ncbi:MAG: thioredoxin fold domain-containing protein [Akkermansiaceae bacterium]
MRQRKPSWTLSYRTCSLASPWFFLIFLLMRGAAFLFGIFLLSSCGDLMEVRTISPRKVKTKKSKTKVEGGLSREGYAPMTPNGYKAPNKDQIAAGSVGTEVSGVLPDQVGEGVKIQGYTLPSDDSIAWSDEFNPDADINFDEAFVKVVKPKSAWFSSFKQARRESIRSGKPLVIWFTRTNEGGSPKCKKLRDEVYNRSDFKIWARKHVVRLKVDLAPPIGRRGDNGEILGKDNDKRKYAKFLEKQYRVHGVPSVIVESPSEGVMAQYRGYRGDSHAYFGKLKDNILTHEHNYNIWRHKMLRKGYREWTGRNGIKVFAKLVKYSNGNLLLVEPDGHKLKTSESLLSRSDRVWLNHEKSRRAKR